MIIYPPQVYLDIARSVNFIDNKEDILNSSEGFNFVFGIASIRCIYSYMAIESFANAMLKNLWESANRNQECFIKDLSLREKGCVPELDNFWKKYCGEKGLDYLWKQELKEKIKIICDAVKKEPINKVNPNLWNNFLKFLRDCRNFNIHMRPAPDFNERIKKLLNPEVIKTWTETVTDIIIYLAPHFAGKEWLKQKTLLNISNAEFLGGKLNQ